MTVSRNTFGGAGTDLGIALSNSTDITIDHNAIDRTPTPPPGFADSYGIGVSSDDASRPTATLICNTFSGWNLNPDNVTQPPCITTGSTIPCATVDQPFSTQLRATTENPDAQLTWRLVSGQLPPGLTLDGPFHVGDKVEYSYTVANTGGTDLHNVQITDDRIADVTCDETTVAPGHATTCHGTHTISQADITSCRTTKERGGDTDKGMCCQLTNVAQATATDPQNNQITSNKATVTITVEVEKKQ
ncbi:DUF7507 domain-containing protein [Streptomyces griseofuscus]|uniref:DUF7507 domain-containing protein n=1 Tax=Streptomyces griseofuscus TaxID=146922 RepID=UPI00155AF836|nr:hypothetical protein [Streptomyces griseofuscus]